MHKKAISAIVALAMTFTLTTSVLATPTSEVTNLTQAEENLNSIKTKIQMLETNLLETHLKQDQTQKDIANKQTEIEQNKIEVDQAIQKVEESQEVFNNRVRSMYKNGNDSVVNVVFESKSFGDLIDRVESIRTIAKHDKAILSDLKAKKDELEAKEDKLEADKQNLDKLEAELQTQIAGFQNEKAQQEGLVAEAIALRDRYQIDEQRDTREAQPIVDDITRNVPSYVPSRGSTSATGNAIVAYAANFLGTPYVWGGSTPQPGFDCSGFVKYVYAHFGISLSRTTYTQVNQGRAVSRSELQPGDLVFFGSASSPYHVGIYVGGGTYIHAPQTGEVIKYSKLGSTFSVARRII